MKNLIGLLEVQKWEAVEGNAGWEQTDFMYQCATWNRARRFVAVRKLIKLVPVKTEIERGLLNIPAYEYFCYVTTERLSPMLVLMKMGRSASLVWKEGDLSDVDRRV